MKRLTQLAGALLVAATLTLLTPASSDAAPRHSRGGYDGGYHYRPSYGGYRGFYGGYRSYYRPWYYGGYGGWRGYGYYPLYSSYDVPSYSYSYAPTYVVPDVYAFGFYP